jgi:flagellar basal body-associated protein FliL
MSEETQSTETNDGTWSGLKKTLIGTISTAVLAGGTWLTTTLFGGGHEDKAETKTEQAAPAPAPVIVNVQQNQENTQKQQNNGGTNTIIRERVIEKAPTEKKVEKKKEETDSPW